jgi:hypothetical protein
VNSVHNYDSAGLYEKWTTSLADLYIAWSSTNSQFAHVPSKESPASRDDTRLARTCSEWSRHEGTGAGLDAVQMVDAAAQYLLALRSLVDTRTLFPAPWPVVRAVAEHVAHAAWLLEPGITSGSNGEAVDGASCGSAAV